MKKLTYQLKTIFILISLTVLSTVIVATGFDILNIEYRLLTIVIANILFYIFAGTVVIYLKEFNHSFKRVIIILFISFLVLSSISITLFIKISKTEHDTNPRTAYGSEQHATNTAIDPNFRYIMDGRIDEWIYVFFNAGLTAIPYNNIAVQEKGQLCFYSFIMMLLQDFNLYPLAVINTIANLMTSVLIFILCKRYINIQTAYFASLGMLFTPDGILWAGILHKESLVVTTIIIIIYSYTQIFIEKRHYYYFLLVLMCYLLSFFRSGIVLPIVLIGFLASLWIEKKMSERILYVCVVACAIIFFPIIFPKTVVQDISNKIFVRAADKLITGSSLAIDSENITYTDTKKNSLLERFGGGDISASKIYFVIPRIFMTLINPFPPWKVRHWNDYYILPATWIMMLLLPYALFGFIRFGFTDIGLNRILTLTIITLSLTIAFAGPFLSERYRLMIMPAYFSFAGQDFVTRGKSYRLISFFSVIFGIMILFLLYTLIK